MILLNDEKEYFEITNSTPWFNIPYFTFSEVKEFLLSRGYCIFKGRAFYTTQMTRSVECTGSVERVGDPVRIQREFVFALKSETDIPFDYDFPDEKVTESLLHNVFNQEIKKKIMGL